MIYLPVLYQVLNKQVPVPVPVPVVQVPVRVPVPNLQVPVPVPVPNLQVPVPVQVLCINYRHSVTLQLHKVKVVVSFIFKKRTARTNELQTQSVVKSVTTVLFYFGWLVLQHLNNMRKFSSWQQVLCYKYQYQYQY